MKLIDEIDIRKPTPKRFSYEYFVQYCQFHVYDTNRRSKRGSKKSKIDK
jgi:hypothetical protein